MRRPSTLNWRTSSFSDGLQCVEVAAMSGHVLVRHSKDTHKPTIGFTRAEWAAFIKGAKAGEFDFA